VTIVILAEGKTERSIRPVLQAFLNEAAEAGGKHPVGLAVKSYKGSELWDADAVTEDARRRLASGRAQAVVVLADVYPKFRTPDEVVRHYRGLRDHRFRVHCALHDFEAWLLPHWERVFQIAGKTPPKRYPWRPPEDVNLAKPPSRVLSELFAPRRGYEKAIDAPRILRSPDDLRVSAAACPQLRAFLNTLLEFAGYGARI
jgi:hypothetical protein